MSSKLDAVTNAILAQLDTTVATGGYKYAHVHRVDLTCDTIADDPTSHPDYLNVKLGAHIDDDGHYLVADSVRDATDKMPDRKSRQVNVLLSPVSQDQLADLIERWGEEQSAVIRRALALAWAIEHGEELRQGARRVAG